MASHIASVEVSGRKFGLVGSSEPAIARLAQFASVVAVGCVNRSKTQRVLESFQGLPIAQQRAILKASVR